MNTCQKTAFFVAAVLLVIAPCVAFGQAMHGPGSPLEWDVPQGIDTPNRLRLEKMFQAGRRCGPNALYMLLRLCDQEVSYQQVIEAVPISDKGASLGALQKAAVKFGVRMEARGDLKPEDLSQRFLPAIIHIRSSGNRAGDDGEDHFLLLSESIRDGQWAGVDTTNMVYTTYGADVIARNMTGSGLLQVPNLVEGRTLAIFIFYTLWITFAGSVLIHLASRLRRSRF